MSKTYLTNKQFSDFDLSLELTARLTQLGFTYCTPIQAATLPYATQGKDIAGQAQTGTGKTIAFLANSVNFLLTHPAPAGSNTTHPRALIIAPTRELVVQIYTEAEKLATPLGLRVALAYGGDGYDKQLQSLAYGVDILVATTGRLIDYIKNKYINLEKLQVIILDEADRMFDLGFIKDLRWLFRQMPPATERVTLLFSATLNFKIRDLAFEHMNDPQYIEIEPEQKTGQYIQEELFHVSNQDKISLLQTLLEEEWPDRCIIFANTKQSCELIASYLLADKLRVGLLTGDIIQKKRLKILDEFTEGQIDILVATDVAARGLHIPAVTHVFNYDLPDDCEDYVHRIGRTGRAGMDGHAITLACERYAMNLPSIEAYIGHNIPISQYDKEALLTELPQPAMKKAKTFRRHSPQKNKTAPKTRTNTINK